MARKKVSEEDKAISKSIGDFIHYCYLKYKGSKPDAAVYKSNFKMLEPLFRNEDDIRVYTLEEMQKVVDVMMESNVAFTSFSIFLWPDLVRAIVDDDKQATRYAVDRITSSQKQHGYFGGKTLNADPPIGW